MDNGHGLVAHSFQVLPYSTEKLNKVKIMNVLLMIRLGSLRPTAQQSFERYHPSCATDLTRTAIHILLYIGHSDEPLASCHLMHMCTGSFYLTSPG